MRSAGLSVSGERCVDTIIAKIRDKLSAVGAPDLIVTIYGQGYRVRPTCAQIKPDLLAQRDALLAALRSAEASLAAVDAAWRAEPLGASESALGAAMPRLREALDAVRSAIALAEDTHHGL